MTSLPERTLAILASPRVVAKRPSTDANWPFDGDPPEDVAALFAACDGLELDDGTRILGREQAAIATKWLRDEKSLVWEDDLFIIGERDDLVIVRDIDRQGLRAGGGVLEAPTDGLESLKRVALGIVGYLELRLGMVDPRPAPEHAARRAAAERDTSTLATLLSAAFYPGCEGEAAHAALTLGELLARNGDEEGALVAFEQYAERRASSARRGAAQIERASAFRAAARVAESAGAIGVAEVCRVRGK